MSSRDVEEPWGNKQDVNQKRMLETKGPGRQALGSLDSLGLPAAQEAPPSSFMSAFLLLLAHGASSMSKEKPQPRTSPFTVIKHLWPPPRLSVLWKWECIGICI